MNKEDYKALLNKLIQGESTKLRQLESRTSSLVSEFVTDWVKQGANTLFGFLLSLSNADYQCFKLFEEFRQDNVALGTMLDSNPSCVLDPIFIAFYYSYGQVPEKTTALHFDFAIKRLVICIQLMNLAKTNYIKLLPYGDGDHEWRLEFESKFDKEVENSEEARTNVLEALATLANPLKTK